MPNSIKAMMCEVGKKPYVKEIPNELESMQNFVGGYIETSFLTKDGLIIVCNEEGMFLNLPINRNLGVKILGNFLVVRADGEEFASISDKDIEVLNRM